MKYRYPKSINTPEGRKVYRRLTRKNRRQAKAFKETRDTLSDTLQKLFDANKVILEKDAIIRRIKLVLTA
jgi:hypothetical protein